MCFFSIKTSVFLGDFPAKIWIRPMWRPPAYSFVRQRQLGRFGHCSFPQRSINRCLVFSSNTRTYINFKYGQIISILMYPIATGVPLNQHMFFWPLEDIQNVQQKNLGWVSNNQIMRGNDWYQVPWSNSKWWTHSCHSTAQNLEGYFQAIIRKMVRSSSAGMTTIGMPWVFFCYSCHFSVTESMNWSTGPVISWTSMFAPVHVIPAVGGLGETLPTNNCSDIFSEKEHTLR